MRKGFISLLNKILFVILLFVSLVSVGIIADCVINNKESRIQAKSAATSVVINYSYTPQNYVTDAKTFSISYSTSTNSHSSGVYALSFDDNMYASGTFKILFSDESYVIYTADAGEWKVASVEYRPTTSDTWNTYTTGTVFTASAYNIRLNLTKIWTAKISINNTSYGSVSSATKVFEDGESLYVSTSTLAGAGWQLHFGDGTTVTGKPNSSDGTYQYRITACYLYRGERGLTGTSYNYDMSVYSSTNKLELDRHCSIEFRVTRETASGRTITVNFSPSSDAFYDMGELTATDGSTFKISVLSGGGANGMTFTITYGSNTYILSARTTEDYYYRITGTSSIYMMITGTQYDYSALSSGITISKPAYLYVTAIQTEKVFSYNYKYDSNTDESSQTNYTVKRNATDTSGEGLTFKGETYTRAGYTQIGWATTSGSSTVEYEFGAATPKETLTLYPVWRGNEYTISYNSNGGSEVADETYLCGDPIVAPDVPTKDGYTFEDWYSDEELTSAYTFDTMPAENFTLYANWEINEYTISFDSNEGSEVSPITQEYLSVVTKPEDPTKEGYTFTGWYSDIECKNEYTFSTMPNKNITLYAGWKVNKYTITFEENGGTEVDDITQDYGTIVISPEDLTKEGYCFDGWYSDPEFEDIYVITTMPANDITLYAKWEVVNYTITYELNDGIVNGENPTNYNVLTESFTLVNPEKEGYSFLGWSGTDIGDGLYSETVTIGQGSTGNRSYTANWEINDYTITFESNGGSEVAPIIQNFGTVVSKPANPTRDGYTFDGWYSDEECTYSYVFTTMPANDVTLYAKWTIIDYVITYTLNGGSVDGTNPTIYNAETETFTLINPTKKGYTFSGWSGTGIEADTYSETVTIAKGSFGSRAYYANWEAITYTITFESNGGSEVAPISQVYNGTISAPADPTRDGFEFQGWYKDEDLSTSYTIPSVMPDENLTLYAKWKANKYTITFNTMGGSAIAPITQDCGSEVTAPEDPTKTDYLFDGWTLNGNPYTITTMPAEDITLVATWVIEEYTITYVLNDGVVDGTNPSTYLPKNGFTLINPTKEGYIFYAWEDENGEKYTSVDTSVKFKGNKTFTALFGTEETTIVDDDVQDFETSYTYTGTSVFDPASIVVSKNGVTLVKGTDYEVYIDGENPGDTTNARENIKVRIEGIGTYVGVVDKYITIDPYQLTASDVVSAINFEKTWDGGDIDFENDLTVTALGNALVYGTDYEVVCDDSDAGGTHEVEITSLNPNYKGITVTYTVNAISEEDMDESLLEYTLNEDTYAYSGETVVVDYTLTYNGYAIKDAATFSFYTDAAHTIGAEAINAGEYYFEFTTDGSSIPAQTYSGKVTIAKLTISDCEVDEGPYSYTGYNPDTQIEVTDENGRVLILNEDYTLTFEEDGNELGTHEVTITGINNYEGTLTAEYTIRQLDLENDADLITWPEDIKPGDANWPTMIIDGHEVTLPNDDFDVKIEVEDPVGSGNWVEATAPYDDDTEYRITVTGKEPNATGSITTIYIPNEDATSTVLQLTDDSSYEWIKYHLVIDSYEEDGDVYEDDYYYRSGYTQLGLIHGVDDTDYSRVVLANVSYKTTLEEFLSNFKTDRTNIRIIGKDGEIYFDCGSVPQALLDDWGVTEEEFLNDTDFFAIGTSTIVQMIVDGSVTDTVYVSVLGDINGDGFYTAADYNAAKTYIKSSTVKDLDDEIKLACYLFNKGATDGKLSAIEYNSLRNYIKKEPEKIATFFVNKDGTSDTGAEMGRNTSTQAPAKTYRNVTVVYNCVSELPENKKAY